MLCFSLCGQLVQETDPSKRKQKAAYAHVLTERVCVRAGASMLMLVLTEFTVTGLNEMSDWCTDWIKYDSEESQKATHGSQSEQSAEPKQPV